MINEVWGVSRSMESLNISAPIIAREYLQLPKVKANKPCIRIFIGNEGDVKDFESLSSDHVALLRKYGNNHGTFPAFNIVPLYRTSNYKLFNTIQSNAPNTKPLSRETIQSLDLKNNWEGKPSTKINRCLIQTSEKLQSILLNQGMVANSSILRLIDIVQKYGQDAIQSFHSSLEECIWKKLQRGEDKELSLQMLLHAIKEEKESKDNFGTSISVILDLHDWSRFTFPVASAETTVEINQALVADEEKTLSNESDSTLPVDAFCCAYSAINDPMPKVKLSNFNVSLRSMFSGQPCQVRYGTIEGSSYPISYENRSCLQAALTWMADESRYETTWTKVDRNELVFVYPSKLSSILPCYAGLLGSQRNINEVSAEGRFEKKAAEFAKVFKGIPSEQKPENVVVFSVRKIDNGRSKVIFSRNYSTNQYYKSPEVWQDGCSNLPCIDITTPIIPFPLDVHKAVNTIWKQNGEKATGAKNLVSRMKCYEGIELLLDNIEPGVLSCYLSLMLQNNLGLFLYIGNQAGKESPCISSTTSEIGVVLSVLALLLYKFGIRKELYMDETAFLLGQLLKVSDNLHALYCKVVRDGSLPPQLAGNSMFILAGDSPFVALATLGQRMIPYIAWAKQYSTKGKEHSTLAKKYLDIYEQLADRLSARMSRFNGWDTFEKSKFFIGYMASLPET